MSEQARMRELDGVRTGPEGEWASVEHYIRSQRQARTGRTKSDDRACPLEFDESGFPVTQRRSSFVERVARLLSPN
jgi:hypothetical protein